MRRRTSSLQCLGVDLVEYKKARAFYARHRRRLGTYFKKAEVSFIEESLKPHEALALVLAAKEAVFKSLDRMWMGPEGFRRIAVVSRKNKKLSFLSKPALSFRKTRNYVVAECRG